MKKKPLYTLIGLLILLSMASCNLGASQVASPTPLPATQAVSPAPGKKGTTVAPGSKTPQRPAIVSISVCSPVDSGNAGSCPQGTFDTQKIVLAPGSSDQVINTLDHFGGVSDEHSSVFAPGSLGNNQDYLIFVASGSMENPSMGLVVLSGGAGPNSHGQWTFDFPSADNYGNYNGTYAQIFLSPTLQGHCPTVADGKPTDQDQTFDLTYAAPGSIVFNPTGPVGSLYMIYEGVNSCEGVAEGKKSGEGSYIAVGVATSSDYGHTWPRYRGSSSFKFDPMPQSNDTQGPWAPTGATGKAVCAGDDCKATLPASYGRYEVMTPSTSLASIMAKGEPLAGKFGDAEPAAFLDDVKAGAALHLYVIHVGPVTKEVEGVSSDRKSDILIARAALNTNKPRLEFQKWDGSAFAEAGIGGLEAPFLADGPYTACGAQNQKRTAPSLSYVEETGQYFLTFVCSSPNDPATGHGAGNPKGGAWFYSTSYDLSDPRTWSTPQEISGSWSPWDNPDLCSNFQGWYPTFMSLGQKPGHLTTSGYAFYLWGCQGGAGDQTPPPRQFSSRVFTITIH